jgi:hypothetical protein
VGAQPAPSMSAPDIERIAAAVALAMSRPLAGPSVTSLCIAWCNSVEARALRAYAP